MYDKCYKRDLYPVEFFTDVVDFTTVGKTMRAYKKYVTMADITPWLGDIEISND